jgi:hypothetical protein
LRTLRIGAIAVVVASKTRLDKPGFLLAERMNGASSAAYVP